MIAEFLDEAVRRSVKDKGKELFRYALEENGLCRRYVKGLIELYYWQVKEERTGIPAKIKMSV